MTDHRIDPAAATAEDADPATPSSPTTHPSYADQAKGLAKKLMDVVTGRGKQ